MAKWLLVGIVSLMVPAVAGAADRKPQPSDPVFVALYERGPAFVSGKGVTEQTHFGEHVTHVLGRPEWRIAGGPFASPESGGKAVGLVVFQAVDAADAEEWSLRDPAVVAKVFNVTVHRWMVTSIKPLEQTTR
jgi:hypothetical protein